MTAEQSPPAPAANDERTALADLKALLPDISDCSLIAAGALVSPRTVVPDGSVVMGAPGRVVREISDAERAYIRRAGKTDRNAIHPRDARVRADNRNNEDTITSELTERQTRRAVPAPYPATLR